jgi:hypothetical protein
VHYFPIIPFYLSSTSPITSFFTPEYSLTPSSLSMAVIASPHISYHTFFDPLVVPITCTHEEEPYNHYSFYNYFLITTSLYTKFVSITLAILGSYIFDLNYYLLFHRQSLSTFFNESIEFQV